MFKWNARRLHDCFGTSDLLNVLLMEKTSENAVDIVLEILQVLFFRHFLWKSLNGCIILRTHILESSDQI